MKDSSSVIEDPYIDEQDAPATLTGEELLSERVRWSGRRYFDQTRNGVYFSQSVSGFEVRFYGTSLSAVLIGGGAEKLCPFLAVTYDSNDNPNNFSRIKVDSYKPEEYNLVSGLPKGFHTVKVYKLSEAAFSSVLLTELTSDGRILQAPKAKRLKIEFFGDSITCGYGIDSTNMEESFSTDTENACKTYAFLTGRMMDADISLLAGSGRCIRRWDDQDVAVPEYFEKVDFSGKVDWNVQEDVPDIVVITLGANDNQRCKCSTLIETRAKLLQYKESYAEFVRRVASVYPNAKIVCCYGLLDELGVFQSIRTMAEELSQEGIKVYSCELPKAKDYPPLALHGHPGITGQIKGADALVAFLETLGYKRVRENISI